MAQAAQDAHWYGGEGKMPKEHVNMMVKRLCVLAKRGKWYWPSVTKKAYSIVSKMLKARAGVVYTKEKLDETVSMLKRRHSLCQNLRGRSGMSYIESAGIYTAPAETWEQLIDVEPDYGLYREAGEPLWSKLVTMFDGYAYWNYLDRFEAEHQSDSDSDGETIVLNLTYQHFTVAVDDLTGTGQIVITSGGTIEADPNAETVVVEAENSEVETEKTEVVEPDSASASASYNEAFQKGAKEILEVLGINEPVSALVPPSNQEAFDKAAQEIIEKYE